MTRPIGNMSMETINRIAEICTSPSLHLHHYGETLLAMREALWAVDVFKSKGIEVVINTNGSASTLSNVRMLFGAGLSKLVISWHRLDERVGGSARNSLSKSPFEASSTKHLASLCEGLLPEDLQRIELIRVVGEEEDEYNVAQELDEFKKLGMLCSIKRKRNLGQVYGISEGPSRPEKCSFLDTPEFAVLWDGSIVACCEVYDARPEWILGNVHSDEDVKRLVSNPGCSLCKGCLGYGGSEIETEKTAI